MTTPQTTDDQADQDRAQTTGEPVLTVEDVDQSFGDLSVLEGVSLDLAPGSVSCVVGANGSGKSTLLRIVAGLLTPDAGTVTVRSTGERSVGYLAQQPGFRPQFTVTETLDFYGELLDASVDVAALVDRVGLEPVADRRVGALSGGMVRLLGIAQATIGDPRLVVLDEPSSGLDPTMGRHIRGVIDDLAGTDRAVLLATHDLGTVELIADQVLVLDEGGIVARGSPAALQDDTETDSLADAVPEFLSGADAVGVSAGRREGDGS
jgi:ABC-2 type transport system ATP-binding protein